MTQRLFSALFLIPFFTLPNAHGQSWQMIGRVAMEDGSPPPKPVGILRVCDGGTVVEARTNKQGRFVMKRVSSGGIEDFDRTSQTTGSIGGGNFGGSVPLMTNCVLRASLSGYVSNTIDLRDPRTRETPNLPPFVLRRGDAEVDVRAEFGLRLPKAARHAWENAVKALETKDWPRVEHHARATVQAQPQFAQGWRVLGAACMNQGKTAEAREAFERSIACDPKLLSSYLLLARVNANAKDWEGVVKASTRLMQVDAKRRYAEARFLLAVAEYHLKNFDAAEQNARALLPEAPQLPRVEYVLGLVLAARRDYVGAVEHLKRYLDLEPKASEADVVKTWIANLGKPGAVQPVPETEAIDLTLPAPGEVWIPGGMKALALAAHVDKPYTAGNFFAVYSEALVRRGEPGSMQSISGYQGTLADYFAAVSELVQAGERKENRTVISLSLATPEKRAQTGRILPLLGWKLTAEAGAIQVELGGNVKDGGRQAVPALLGIDEMSMKETIEAGRDFTIEIVSESARLMGGGAWGAMLPADVTLAGGLAEAFARDSRLPKLYAAVSAMGNDAAAALVEAVGLRTLATQHANLVWNNAEAFRLAGAAAAVPGGGDPAAVWTRLVGPSPRDAKGFFRALFQKDRGRLAAFYATVARCDAAHQRFLTRTADDAARYYSLFRDPYSVVRPGDTPRGTWPPRYFQNLPLDGAGRLRFPGSRLAWTNSAAADAKLLAELESPEALIAVARLEAARKAPLDGASAKTLARRYAEWRGLFPYFERLPGLGAQEFTAIEAFAADAGSLETGKRNLVLGQWHSLVELIALGVESGALDTASSARLFRRVCVELPGRDSSARAVAILRDMTGQSADVDEAVPAKLLRLAGERRAAFDRVMDMQKVPRLNAPDDASVLAALSGLVYAARLDPGTLVLREDAGFARRHRFADSSPDSPVFLPTSLRLSSAPPGSYFIGGFSGFAGTARKLSRGRVESPAVSGQAATSAAAPAPSFAKAAARDGVAVFRADARLVEVYATVTDARGRYIDNLRADGFEVLDDGKPQPIKAFEPSSAGLRCALLLDATGSMQAALPALKNAALRLIAELREIDSVAVDSFSEAVVERQAFTKDKRAAKRAVLPAYPHGRTALYDALTEVAYSIAGHSGKKVIVVFTDGDDNQSSVTAEQAIRRAKLAGVPVYTIAQGAALNHPTLLKQLENISTTTGGLAFSIRDPRQIQTVFEHVASDLKHGYLLAYRPPETKSVEWRRIEVRLSGAKQHKVRAREGYYPQ
jgi:VWFA-related protein